MPGVVPVALLLPLSGDQSLASVGRSLANASKLAVAFIEANPNIAENITITLRDTGDSPAGAVSAANAAVAGGAKLIVGPLRGDQVAAVLRRNRAPTALYALPNSVSQPKSIVALGLPEAMSRILLVCRHPRVPVLCCRPIRPMESLQAKS